MIVSPSLLSADFGNLNRDIEMINRSEAEMLHLDVMDGVFVPNISFGFPVMKCIQKVSKKPLDVHLMIVEPQKFVNEVRDCGAHLMNVHYEACTHLNRVIQQIKAAGMKAGPVHPARRFYFPEHFVLFPSRPSRHPVPVPGRFVRDGLGLFLLPCGAVVQCPAGG